MKLQPHLKIALIVLLILISTVITVIGNDMITSVLLIAAVLILLLRTRLENFIDAVFVVWVFVEGMACEHGAYVVAVVCSALICILFVLLRCLLSGRTVYITVHGTNG